jgi:hypothetical protein
LNATHKFPQKQQNYRNKSDRLRKGENRFPNGGGRYSRNNDKNNHENNNQNFKHQRNNGQNRQRFARTIKISQLSSGLRKEIKCLNSFDMLAKFTNENVDFDAPHFDFNEIYEACVTLPMKDISAYDSIVEEGSKSSYKLLEFLIIKSLKQNTDDCQGQWKP